MSNFKDQKRRIQSTQGGLITFFLNIHLSILSHDVSVLQAFTTDQVQNTVSKTYVSSHFKVESPSVV